jgi:Domain of unknown function (DUF5666)
VKALIRPLVLGALLAGGLSLAIAQTPAGQPSPDVKVEKSADRDETVAGQTAVGRVKSVSADTLVVLGKSQGKAAEWTFALDTKTRIRKAGKDITVADLKEGDGVQVRYTEQGGKHVAQTVRARSMPPRPEANPAEKKP